MIDTSNQPDPVTAAKMLCQYYYSIGEDPKIEDHKVIQYADEFNTDSKSVILEMDKYQSQSLDVINYLFLSEQTKPTLNEIMDVLYREAKRRGFKKQSGPYIDMFDNVDLPMRLTIKTRTNPLTDDQFRYVTTVIKLISKSRTLSINMKNSVGAMLLSELFKCQYQILQSINQNK